MTIAAAQFPTAGLGVLRANAFASFVVQGWTSALGLVAVPFQLRLLGADAFGVLGLLAVFDSVVQLIDTSVTVAVGREIAGCDATALGRRAAVFERAYVLLGAVSVVVLFLLAGPGAAFLYGATAALRLLVSYHRSVQQGLQDHARLGRLTASFVTVRLLGGVAVLAVRPELDVFLLWNLGATAAELLALRQVTADRVGGGHEVTSADVTESISLIRSFVARMSALAVVSFAINQADRVLLGARVPLADIGHYMFAKTLAGGLVLFATPVLAAAVPAFSKAYAAGDRTALCSFYHDLNRLIAAAASPAALFLCCFAPEIIAVLGGEEARGAAPVLRIMSLGFLLYVYNATAYSLQLGTGEGGIPLAVNLIALPVVWAVTWVLIPRHGAAAAAYGFLVLNALALSISGLLTHRRLLPGEGRRWLLEDLLPGLTISAAVLVPCSVFAAMLGTPLTRLAAGAAAAATTGLLLVARARR